MARLAARLIAVSFAPFPTSIETTLPPVAPSAMNPTTGGGQFDFSTAGTRLDQRACVERGDGQRLVHAENLHGESCLGVAGDGVYLDRIRVEVGR
jgi:hypothetical protein